MVELLLSTISTSSFYRFLKRFLVVEDTFQCIRASFGELNALLDTTALRDVPKAHHHCIMVISILIFPTTYVIDTMRKTSSFWVHYLAAVTKKFIKVVDCLCA